jgi:hypothetical protein
LSEFAPHLLWTLAVIPLPWNAAALWWTVRFRRDVRGAGVALLGTGVAAASLLFMFWALVA